MSRQKTKSLTCALAAVAAIAVMGISASAASAAPAAFNIPANSSANGKLSGTLSVSGSGGTTSCTFTNVPLQIVNTGSPSQGILGLNTELVKTKCANGYTLGISAALSGVKNGSVFTVKNTAPGMASFNPFPGGVYWQPKGFEVPWTNGAGATASKITFNNTFVAISGGVSTFTGSLNVSKADGSLLLLS